jgi:hypothetical protein
MPAGDAAPAKKGGMGWFKFIINFQLFAAAVVSLINAFTFLSGTIYGSREVAENLYYIYPEMKLLTMALGYSHDIQIMLPKEVTAETPQVRKGENPVLILKSADKQLVGQVAAKIRSFRRPEPYKGKGIKFAGETLRRKAGKTASAK